VNDRYPLSDSVRYRVVLVALPEGGADALRDALPRPEDLVAADLPVALRLTDQLQAAEATAERLLEAGAQVIVITEWGRGSFCEVHPADLNNARCEICERAICSRCVLAAEGDRLCDEHREKAEVLARWVWLRQLMTATLFALFLFHAADYLLQDRRVSLDPPVVVGLFQFVPPGAEGHPLVRGLNSASPATSWRAMKGWYDGEYLRYTGSRREVLDLRVQGPFERQLEVPLLGRASGTLGAAWEAFVYARYWRRLSQRVGVDPRPFGARVYVVFTPEGGDQASHSRGSERGRIAVAHIALGETNPAYALVTVAHELAHVLGASDKYDERTWGAAFPEGFVEPFVERTYPQRYAELMAVDKPVGPGVEVEVGALSEVRVGHRTAAEMKWIATAQADYFYDRGGRDPSTDLTLDEARPSE